MSELMDKIRTLVNNDYEAQFRLTQKKNDDGEKTQYLEIVGTSLTDVDNIYRDFIKIETVFSHFPPELDQKQINLAIDPTTCQHVFSRFAQRLMAIPDEVVTIFFSK